MKVTETSPHYKKVWIFHALGHGHGSTGSNPSYSPSEHHQIGKFVSDDINLWYKNADGFIQIKPCKVRIGVLRHMQRYFSHICDGTDVQADWRRSRHRRKNCTYGRAPNAIDILQGSLTCSYYTDTGPPFLYGDSVLSRLLRHAGDTEDVFSTLTPGVLTGAVQGECCWCSKRSWLAPLTAWSFYAGTRKIRMQNSHYRQFTDCMITQTGSFQSSLARCVSVYWCFTSHATIFQSYMWRHIEVQADWKEVVPTVGLPTP